MSRFVVSILSSMADNSADMSMVVLEGLLVQRIELLFEFAQGLLKLEQIDGSFHEVSWAACRLSTDGYFAKHQQVKPRNTRNTRNKNQAMPEFGFFLCVPCILW